MAVTYFILRNPGHNRVYFDQSKQMALAELKIAGSNLSSSCNNVKTVVIAGVEYVSFQSPAKLSQKDLEIISRLSFTYALFEGVDANNKLLFSPIALDKGEYMDEKISTLLKYPGKTNELFTRMMINVALLSSGFHDEDCIELLDPVAGKGTTLFAGLIHGFNVSGIEIGKNAVHEACVFFKKNLELERYKHTFSQQKLFGSDKDLAATKNEFEFARNKAEFKDDKSKKRLTFVAGNSIYTNNYFKKNLFHIIVGDLPYGVAHGNITKQKQSSLTRNPSELLAACLPAWHRVLKKNGAIVLAFNSFVLPGESITELLQSNGFNVFIDSPYDEFEHSVDRSIKRDIVVAIK